MKEITASMVKELRETSGAGMMDCKAALKECNGDMAAAVDWLRTKGLAKAAKKAGKVEVMIYFDKQVLKEENKLPDYLIACFRKNDIFFSEDKTPKPP